MKVHPFIGEDYAFKFKLSVISKVPKTDLDSFYSVAFFTFFTITTSPSPEADLCRLRAIVIL